MNILIINYYHAPTTDAHAYRWSQISRHWAAQGWSVKVLTGKIHGEPKEETLDDVSIRRVGILGKGSVQMVNAGQASRSGAIKTKILDFFRPIYRKLYWPDATWHWIPSVFWEVLKHRNTRFDIVVSYYPCFGAHLAAKLLKSTSKYPDFKWIVDYGDPFCASDTWQPNNYSLYDKLNRAVERHFAEVGSMVLTNEETRDAYVEKIQNAENISVISHLVDVNGFYSNIRPQASDEPREIRLLYIGAFHKNIREPYRLIELVKKLNQKMDVDIFLDLYGPANGFDLNPKDCPQVRHWGYLERSKAIEKMKSADFIVNVDNENCVMTPSKIVECIATGRPIINIANPETNYPPLKRYEEEGFALPVMSEVVTDEDAELVSEFIERHIESESASIAVVERVLDQHILSNVASQYQKL